MHGLLIRKFTNHLTNFLIVALIAKRDYQHVIHFEKVEQEYLRRMRF